MFSTKPISQDSRTIAIVRNNATKKVEKEIWFTEKSRSLDLSKAGDFKEEMKPFSNGKVFEETIDFSKYRFEPVPHGRVTTKFPRFVNYYLAQSNSGKSYSIAQYCKHYIEAFPKNFIIYASANPITNDKNYDSIRDKIKELDLMKLEQVIDFLEFKDCLFVFDDCDSMFSTNMTDLDERLTEEAVLELSVKERDTARKMLQNKAKMVTDLLNNSIKSLMFNGRKNNISLCIVGHKYNDGFFQRTVLNESTGTIVFPYSVSKPTLYSFLKNKLNFNSDEADEVCMLEWYQYDFLFVNTTGKPFIITPDKIKLF